LDTVLQLFSWLRAHPWVLAPACYLVTVLLLFWLRPLWLLKLDDVLQPMSLKIPVLNVELSPRALLPLKHHPRVLDAWVDRKLEVVRRKFAALDIVDERKIFIPIPASLEHQQQHELLLEPRPEDLREVFASKRVCLLIRGEGGAGKTTLAFQIARWGMEGRELGGHRMLPVLFWQELEEKPRSFEEAIRGQLEDLTEETLSESLLDALLRHRRVLVVVECFSELSERTRRQIQPSRADFPVYAMLITSRLKEDELGVSKSVLEPRRIEGNRLSNFMNAYLELRGKRDLLDDEEYFEACRRLSQMVGQRQVTVLLAKIFAEQLIEKLERNTSEVSPGSFSETLPDNIPDLMRSYVNALNRALMRDRRRDDQEVQQDAKRVAWECLQEAHYPRPAGRQDILNALATRAGDAEARLSYLEERLRLVRSIDPGDKLRFSLDPLAEYLAGLYLVEKLGADEAAWLQFLAEAEARAGGAQQTQGFLLAIRDCYLVKIPGATESSLVPRKLAELAGLDPEVIQRAQRRQRIRRLISCLSFPDIEERFDAAKALGAMRNGAREAVPVLVQTLEKDSDARVRRVAAWALGRIGAAAKGEAAKEAVPVLVRTLEKDSDAEVREKAAEALRKMGEKGEAVPAYLPVMH
jgi:HEAT repeat protein